MSAWIVDEGHIDYLIASALAYRDGHGFTWYHDGQIHRLDHTNRDEVGQMLLDECVRSVSYRYPDDAPSELPGSCGASWLLPYQYREVWTVVDPVVAIKAIQCYEYQSCEHPEWKASSARAFCKSLTGSAVGHLPGYDDAPWGIERRGEHVAAY